GRIVVAAVGAGAKSLRGSLSATLRAIESDLVVERLELEPAGDGRFVATAPVGAWRVRVVPEGWFDDAFDLSASISVASGKDSKLNWVVPAPLVQVILDGSAVADSDESGSIVFRSAGTTLRMRRGTRFLVPAGEWTVSVEDRAGKSIA